jgi:Tfp pilus assembly protein PilV
VIAVTSRLRRRLTGRKFRSDAGISLIELLVAMVIVIIIGIIVSSTYAATVRQITVSQGINLNAKQASDGMNEASRQIRAATSNPVLGNVTADPAIVSATNETLVLYTYVNLQSASVQQPEMVRLRVDPTTRQLFEDIWPATASGTYWIFPSTSTTPASTKTLTSTVATASASPYLFTYLVGSTILPVPTTGVFTAAQRASITSIQVTLTVQGSTSNASQAVTLQNTVGMPNLNQ